MIFNIKEVYDWEIELIDGTIINEGNKFDFNKVVRCSYIPTIKLFPRHDIIFTDFKLKKRFARAFMGWNSMVREYLHCAITNKFRVYIKSTNGSCIITPKNYSMRI
jgi:hypothetical protein